MNAAKYFWDLNPAAMRETRRVLQDPTHPRFLERMVTLLSRCDKPKELFSLLPRGRFVETWPRIRSYWLKRARQSVHRDWWDTIYEQVVEIPGQRPLGKSSDLFRKVGHAMKKRRIELGLSQKQVATQTRLSQPAISQIEEGKKNITLFTLLRLCKVLKLSSLAFSVSCIVFVAAFVCAEAPLPNDFPVYVAKVPNVNDYSLFANGGWDGNWYVGSNTCWIKRLPPVPGGNYARAYIGARLGRMKLVSNPKNVWDKQPVPGEIYMAISSTIAWTRDRSFLLTNTADIPLEGDAESAVEGSGESQWFWAEIPLPDVNMMGDNYIALWSPTPYLLNMASSPVLAAAWGGKEPDTWLLRDIGGVPPRDVKDNLGAPISYFQPALALKLIPKGPPHALTVKVAGWKSGTADHPKPVVTARVEGDSVEKVWLEYESVSGWTKIGRFLWKAPYILTLDSVRLPPGRIKLRVAASNIWEERAASAPFTVDVSVPKGSAQKTAR